MATFQDTTNIRTLEEAVSEVRPYRSLELAAQPMSNYSSTPGTNNGIKIVGTSPQQHAHWSAWTLGSRPRRIALLVYGAQEEYRPHLEEIMPKLGALVKSFRARKAPIIWASWGRRFDDGICNAMDRWYGPRGLQPGDPQNDLYITKGREGLETLKEIAPTEEEKEASGVFFHSETLDMFWTFQSDGKSYLDETLKVHGVDTIVLAGYGTDGRILSTAFSGFSRGYDVVVAGDAVVTNTANQERALVILNGTCGKVLGTAGICSYMYHEFKPCEKGEAKGAKYPDGRLEHLDI